MDLRLPAFPVVHGMDGIEAAETQIAEAFLQASRKALEVALQALREKDEETLEKVREAFFSLLEKFNLRDGECEFTRDTEEFLEHTHGKITVWLPHHLEAFKEEIEAYRERFVPVVCSEEAFEKVASVKNLPNLTWAWKGLINVGENLLRQLEEATCTKTNIK